MTTHRRPTRKEADTLLLNLADRLERIAHTLDIVATIDVHRKNGHVAYLQSEASNVRSFVRREPRFL